MVPREIVSLVFSPPIRPCKFFIRRVGTQCLENINIVGDDFTCLYPSWVQLSSIRFFYKDVVRVSCVILKLPEEVDRPIQDELIARTVPATTSHVRRLHKDHGCTGPDVRSFYHNGTPLRDF